MQNGEWLVPRGRTNKRKPVAAEVSNTLCGHIHRTTCHGWAVWHREDVRSADDPTGRGWGRENVSLPLDKAQGY